MIELLAPGGSEAKMRTAFEYGADAVYLGGEAFGLRANAGNFNIAQIAERRRPLPSGAGKKFMSR